jgi:hypothetical protein
MGRFLTSRAVQPSTPLAGGSSAVASSPPPPASAAPFAKLTVPRRWALQAAPSAKPANPSPSASQILGCYAVGAYLVSGYATDISLHLLGGKPYLSVVAGLATFVLFALSMAPLRALESKIGRLWLFMMVWLIVDIPFSRWPSGSLDLLDGYLPKAHLILFFICAFALTVHQCRSLFYINALGSFSLLLACLAYGAEDGGGRFVIPDSILSSGPNDLGFQLVVCIGFFVFLMLERRPVLRLLGAGGLLADLYFLMKTSSRGSAVACIAMMIACFLFTRFRVKLMLISIPLLAILPMISGNMLHRLSLIFSDPDLIESESAQDAGAVGSQVERQELLKASLKYMVTRPLSGVGPGQFADSYWRDSKKEGKHVASLGTHNSYTQLGAECGLPVFFCYAGVIILCIHSNYRLYKSTVDNPELRDIMQMSFCLFLGSIGLATNALFHHMAYSVYVPLFGGLSVCLQLMAKPYLQRK